MRQTWMLHARTDRMGDDAWLWKLRCEFHKFTYVDFDLRSTNQHDEALRASITHFDRH